MMASARHKNCTPIPVKLEKIKGAGSQTNEHLIRVHVVYTCSV